MRCLYCNKRLGLFASKKRLFCSDLHEDWFRDEKAGIGIERLLNPFNAGTPRKAEGARAENGDVEPEPTPDAQAVAPPGVSYLESLPAPVQTDFALKTGSLELEIDLRPAGAPSLAWMSAGWDLAPAIGTLSTPVDATTKSLAYEFESMMPRVRLLANPPGIAGEVLPPWSGPVEPVEGLLAGLETASLHTAILPIPQRPLVSSHRDLRRVASGPSFEARRFLIERPLTSVSPRQAPAQRLVADAGTLLPESPSLSRPLELLLTVLQPPKQARQRIPPFSDFEKSAEMVESLVLKQPGGVFLRALPSPFAPLGWAQADGPEPPWVPASAPVQRDFAAGVLAPCRGWEEVPVAVLPAAPPHLRREPQRTGALCEMDFGGVAVREAGLRQPAPVMDAGRLALRMAAAAEIEMAWEKAAEISFAVENSSPGIPFRMPEASSEPGRQELRWAEIAVVWNGQKGIEREIELEGLRSEARELQSPAAPAMGAFTRLRGFAFVEEGPVPIPAMRRALEAADPMESDFRANALRYPGVLDEPELEPGIAQAFNRFGGMQYPAEVSCPQAVASDWEFPVLPPAAWFEDAPPLAPRQKIHAHVQWQLALPSTVNLKPAEFRDRRCTIRRPQPPDAPALALEPRKTWTPGVEPEAGVEPFAPLVSAGPQRFRSAAHIQFREPGLRMPAVGSMPEGKAALSRPCARLAVQLQPHPAAIPLRPGLRYHSPLTGL